METPTIEPEPASWRPGGGRVCPEPLGLKAFAPVYCQVSNTRFSVAGASQRGASPAAACDRKGKLVRLGLHRGNAANHGLVVAPLLLLAGLITACGQDANGAAENTAANDAQPSAVVGAIPDAEAAEPAAAETAPAKAEPAATVAVLPLKRGFYVASDTPCGQASNATTLLVSREGINGSRDRCTFKKIEKAGATTFRVTSECSDGGAAWGREDTVETYTQTYDIPNETSFTVTYEDGSVKSARYCAQSSMSPDFRDNDISDVTG